MIIEYAGKTHCGLVRLNNEDNFWINGKYKTNVKLKEYELAGKTENTPFAAAVCDGMGGEEKGELASLYTVECMKCSSYEDVRATATRTIHEANRKICDLMQENNGRRSGSTFAAIYIDQGKAICYNLGDSRIYRFRDCKLEQISVDHTKVQAMIEHGLLTKENAVNWSGKNKLTQYLGVFEEEMILEPYCCEIQDVLLEDIYILCSDGLTDMLWGEEIQDIILCNDNVSKIREQLISEALFSGGRDNITVIVIRIK